MQLTPQGLRAVANGFNSHFMRGFEQPSSEKDLIASTVPSTRALENYGWMKTLPSMREWVGQRVINNLSAHQYKLANKKWENTLGVARTDFEDDAFGIYANAMAMMGEDAALHPDDLVFNKLLDGFDATGGLAFDGQYFFDSDHLGYDKNGKEISVSNVQAGAENAWFLADLSRNYRKPMIFQMRSEVEFAQKDKPEDDNVFLEDELLYGVRARYNAGYAWYQLIVGSKAELTPDSYEAARALLHSHRNAAGRKLGLKATHLIYGTSNEGAAREILINERTTAGATNTWRGTATGVLSAWLD